MIREFVRRANLDSEVDILAVSHTIALRSQTWGDHTSVGGGTGVFRRRRKYIITGGSIDTLLSANTSFQGHLKTDGNVRIEGAYEGAIETVGNVLIAETARVNAEITAHAVQVWGWVAGHITASERLEILPTGRVFADIEVSSLMIDEGGVFRGQCTIRGPGYEWPAPAETPAVEKELENKGL